MVGRKEIKDGNLWHFRRPALAVPTRVSPVPSGLSCTDEPGLPTGRGNRWRTQGPCGNLPVHLFPEVSESGINAGFL
jgi:hypothetical protein